MKKILLILSLSTLCCFVGKSQNVSIEESTFGIQTGLFGIWAHQEKKISNQLALRFELGLDAGIWTGSLHPKTGYIMGPLISMTPKWYYNLNKRASKSQNTIKNSGNFISVQTNFNPDWFAISNYENVETVNQITVIPTWGIRRIIGDHFVYETGIGLGYRCIFTKTIGYSENKEQAVLNLLLKIGYQF